MRRTIAWAKRCRAEFDRLMAQKRLPQDERPLLFGVVQGGGSPELRTECAAALMEIGFDGYGYGGWPLDAEGQLVDQMLRITRSLDSARSSPCMPWASATLLNIVCLCAAWLCDLSTAPCPRAMPAAAVSISWPATPRCRQRSLVSFPVHHRRQVHQGSRAGGPYL